MRTVTRNAYAKVNLCLDVLRRREDGYHDVSMIMHNLDLHDVLTFSVEEMDAQKEKVNSYDISISTNREDIPVDNSNLVYKAIKMMCDLYHLTGKIKVKLEKNIPVAAGMAGGSTDCAAAFHAMNTLFDLKLSKDTLMELGVQLGADVPYCILALPALSEGIGEILTPVTPLMDCYILVAKPDISVSTKMVYTNLKANELEHHPNVGGMVDALKEKDVKKVASYMENVLETVTVNLYPEIEQLKSEMKQQGALNAIMSGSGPTVFGIYETKHQCQKAADYMREKNLAKEVFVTVPV